MIDNEDRKHIEKLIDKGVKIIFTVDCGTLSFDPIKFLKKKRLTL